MKASEKHHWDTFWDDRQQVEDTYLNTERLVINMLKVVPDPKGLRILEVGAGTGRDSFALAARGAEVHVLDYSRPSLKIMNTLNEKFPDKVEMMIADGLRMPYADGSFDVVFHHGLLEHFRDPRILLRENIRLLKPGGLLVIGVPQTFHPYTVLKKSMIALNVWFAGWETQFTLGGLERLLQSEGLTVVHSYGEWMYPSLPYRMTREVLKKVGLKLPLYPKTPLAPMRASLRESLLRSRFFLNTCITIGVIARK